METAKYKILPPAFSKRMIREQLKKAGFTNIRYSGKTKTFYFLDEKGEECKRKL